jgi:hypothetical protein
MGVICAIVPLHISPQPQNFPLWEGGICEERANDGRGRYPALLENVSINTKHSNLTRPYLRSATLPKGEGFILSEQSCSGRKGSQMAGFIKDLGNLTPV